MRKRPSLHAITTPKRDSRSKIADIKLFCQRIHDRLLKVIADVQEQMRRR